ncbi:MAG: hypothetical protein BWY70_01991 [Bacteroidetes bacterium ADurb.Bin408]|nr:MAG: hypothetical protein BWY70_01991 [Bacteroidetes bacterium ADurb.Bin408]
MEIINFLQPFGLPIDTVMIFIVVLSGEWQKKYLADVTRFNGALKTLLVSFIACTIYGFLFSFAYKFQRDLPLKWFFSYVVATSLYELFFKTLIGKLFTKTESKE